MRTQLGGSLLKDGDVGREDLNHNTPGRAVVRRVLAGAGLTLDSTGADHGTGDVTLSLAAAVNNYVIKTDVNFGPPTVPEATATDMFVPVSWLADVTVVEALFIPEASEDHDAADAFAEELRLMIDDIVEGSGIHVSAEAPNGAYGRYRIAIIGR